MIDIADARESYRSFEMTSIGHVNTANNPSDGLSKLKENEASRKLM